MAPRRTVGNWEIEDVIGQGSFAIVWKARHTVTGALAAVKEINTDKLNRKLQESLNSEIAVLQRVKHVNIVGLLDLFKVGRSFRTQGVFQHVSPFQPGLGLWATTPHMQLADMNSFQRRACTA